MKIIASLLVIYFAIGTLILLYFLFGGVKWVTPNEETGELEQFDQVYWLDLICVCLLWIIIIPMLIRNRRRFEDES